MDFDESAAEKEFREHVRKVIEERIKPEHRAWKAARTTPHEMYRILGEEGLTGFREKGDEVVPVPWQQNIHFYREAAELDGGFAIAAFANSQLGMQALQLYCNDEQRKKYLIPGVRGERIFALANTEPGAGSDAAGISLKAEDKGDHFLVNGSKSYITNADIADHIVFTAVTHPEEEKKHRRISMFIVDGNRVAGDVNCGNTEGLSRSRLKKIGWRISHLSVLHFKNVKIPKENMIGESKRGFYQTMHVFNNGRIGVAALALGTGLGAYRHAFRHAKKREAFGKTLFELESKRNEFSDNIAKLQAGWLLVQKAAFLRDTGKEFRYNAAMAKLYCTEEALEVSEWAAQTFGARGLMESIPVSQYPLDAKAAMMGEGAAEVQKKIVAEHIGELLEEM